MITLLVLSVCMSIPLLLLAIAYFVKDSMKNNSQMGRLCMVSMEEIEEAKKYATVFGLDNETVDIDITVLLKMGRKMNDCIGKDKVEEIHATIVRANMDLHFYQNPESRGTHHRINLLMKAHDLVAVAAPSFIKINKTFGGDKDGEPTNISA